MLPAACFGALDPEAGIAHGRRLGLQGKPGGRLGPKIQYFSHQNTFSQIEPFFPSLKKEDLPDGEGWAVEMVQLSTHNGTHLDAPYHLHSTNDKVLGTPGAGRVIKAMQMVLVALRIPGGSVLDLARCVRPGSCGYVDSMWARIGVDQRQTKQT